MTGRLLVGELSFFFKEITITILGIIIIDTDEKAPTVENELTL